MVVDTSHNSSFSVLQPGLQLAVDSTSLGEAKSCFRKYKYAIIDGYQPRLESVHLTFGILLHSASERYQHRKAEGASHEASLRDVVSWALRATWNKELNRPWSSDHRTKNRETLLRTIIWYLDKFGENDVLETVILANGEPAVELSFAFEFGLLSSMGEPYQLCGHFDRIARMNDELYIPDIKSTEHTLAPDYFKKFTPHGQFSLYLFAGQIVFQQPVKQLIVDACQVASKWSHFHRHPVHRDEAMLDEWLRDTQVLLAQLEQAALDQYWPMNDKACDMYGGCVFRQVCSASPATRQLWLDKDFRKRVWNPLEKRGDI